MSRSNIAWALGHTAAKPGRGAIGDLVLYQDTDGGQVTEIMAPDDAQFRRTKGDEIALFVPGCEIGLSADDVLALARDCRFGLRIA